MVVERNPLVSVLALAAVYAAIIYASAFVLWPKQDGGSSELWQTSSMRDLNLHILFVQAALAGIIYPIVIGLIGLLFQVGERGAARLSVYFKETETIIAGGSALVFVSILSIEVSFLSLLKPPQLAVLTALNLTWFIVNLFGIGHFLWNSLRFIKPDMRLGLIKKYLANVIWPNEVDRLLAINHFLNATHYGYLPSGNAKNGDPIIETGPFTSRGLYSVQRKLSRGRLFTNYWFWLAEFIFNRWRVRAKTFLEKQGKTVDEWSAPRLQIPLLPGETYPTDRKARKVDLCLISGGPDLTKFERALLRMTARFSGNRAEEGPTESDKIFGELVWVVVEHIESNRVTGFEDSIRELIDFHVFLFQISWAESKNGDLVSLAQLEDYTGFFGERVHDKWRHQYRDIFKRVISRLETEPEFFNRATRFGSNLFQRALDFAPPDITARFTQLPISLFYHLGRWWKLTLETQTSVKHDAWNSVELSRPYYSHHAKALREFTAGWDQMIQAVFGHKDPTGKNWRNVTDQFPVLDAHLEGTATMVANRIWNGDKLGALWSTDSLLKWLQLTQWDIYGTRHLGRSLITPLVQVDIFEIEWDEVKGNLDIVGPQEDVKPFDIFYAAIENYWTDVQLLVIAVLINWSRHKPESIDGAIFFAKRVLSGIPHESDSMAEGNLRRFSNAESILTSLIRQFSSGERYGRTYRTRLDRVVSALDRVSDREWVSGRIYTGVGGPGIGELFEAYSILLLILAGDGQSNYSGILRTLQRIAEKDDEAARGVGSLLEKLINTLKNAEFQSFRPTLIHFSDRFESAKTFEKSRFSLIKALNECSDALNSTRDENIRDAEIDPDKLNELARAASTEVFNRTNINAPINSFAEFNETTEELVTKYNLVWNNFEKGSLTEPPMDHPIGNVGQVIAEGIANYVPARVLGDVIAKLLKRTLIIDDAEKYWGAIKEEAARILEKSQTPLLLVAIEDTPKWILDWIWPTGSEDEIARPLDMARSDSQENHSRYYMAHLNEIGVYRVAIARGASFILPKEVFKEVRFRRFPNGQFLEPSYEPEDDPWKIKLIFGVNFETTVSDDEILQIDQSAPQSANSQ